VVTVVTMVITDTVGSVDLVCDALMERNTKTVFLLSLGMFFVFMMPTYPYKKRLKRQIGETTGYCGEASI